MLELVALIAATIATGLIAGLFYAVSYAIMPGLHQTDDRTFVHAMQRINVAIINGRFLTCFMGAPILIILAGVLQFGEGGAELAWIVAAFVMYGATLVITGRVNVPLNNELDAAGDPDRVADLAAVRARFEPRWNRWNDVRALTSTAAFACLAWVLVLHGSA